jgi:hypothetical protein
MIFTNQREKISTAHGQRHLRRGKERNLKQAVAHGLAAHTGLIRGQASFSAINI